MLCFLNYSETKRSKSKLLVFCAVYSSIPIDTNFSKEYFDRGEDVPSRMLATTCTRQANVSHDFHDQSTKEPLLKRK